MAAPFAGAFAFRGSRMPEVRPSRYLRYRGRRVHTFDAVCEARAEAERPGFDVLGAHEAAEDALAWLECRREHVRAALTPER